MHGSSIFYHPCVNSNYIEMRFEGYFQSGLSNC